MLFNAHSYRQYKETALSTLAPGELLVKLYDELIKQMRVASLGYGKGSDDLAGEALTKAQTIIVSLESYLHTGEGIAASLRDFYAFLAERLAAATEEKNPARIEELVPMVRELRDSFDQADKEARKNKSK